MLQQQPNFLTPVTNPFSLTKVNFFSKPTFVDIDGDTKLDVFVGERPWDGSQANIYYYRNIGSASSPKFDLPQTNPFGLKTGNEFTLPTFADIDGDKDLDAFVGDAHQIYYYKNIGSVNSPKFDQPQTNPFNLTMPFVWYPIPTFVDIDNDTDLDAFVGVYEGITYYYKNIGSASNPIFDKPVINPFGLEKVTWAESVSPTFVDIDKDGDQDAFLGDYAGTYYYQNIGTADNPSFAKSQMNPFGLTTASMYSRPSFADIDQDGDQDAFLGEYNGNIYYFENGVANSAPTDIALDKNSIDENTTGVVGNLITSEPDATDTFTYSLVPSEAGSLDNSAFTIENNQLKINASPDFETKSVYNIRVRATDKGGLYTEQDLQIYVNDLDEFVYGTAGNDVLRGTASADQIDGGTGSDQLYGNAGNDQILGGDGNDMVYGGNDNDTISGGNGSDRLYGDAGHDLILGDAGNDILNGGEGDDILDGGAGSDQLYGNNGRDTFVLASGMGWDYIYGFQNNLDLMQLNGGLTFDALKIVQSGTSTFIKVLATGETIASLMNTSSTLIDSADFSFGAVQPE